MCIDTVALGISRQLLHQALLAEGVPALSASTRTYMLPMYEKNSLRRQGFPWTNEV